MALDPYASWLGIPPDRQPPDHYDLLGVPADERDPQLLGHAAQLRAEMVRKHAEGEAREVAEKILGEIEAAAACLTESEQRQAYDQTRLAALAESWVCGEKLPGDVYRLLGHRRFTQFQRPLCQSIAAMRQRLESLAARDGISAERVGQVKHLLVLAHRVTTNHEICWKYHQQILTRMREQFAAKYGEDATKWERKELHGWLQRTARVHPRQIKVVAAAMTEPPAEARRLVLTALFGVQTNGKTKSADKEAASPPTTPEDLESWLVDQISGEVTAGESGLALGKLDSQLETDDTGEEETGGFRCPYPDCRSPLDPGYAKFPNLPCPECGRVRIGRGVGNTDLHELSRGKERKALPSEAVVSAAWGWLLRMIGLGLLASVLLLFLVGYFMSSWKPAIGLSVLATYLLVSPFTLLLASQARTKRLLESEMANYFALRIGGATVLLVGSVVAVAWLVSNEPPGLAAGVGLPLLAVSGYLLYYLVHSFGALADALKVPATAGIGIAISFYLYTLLAVGLAVGVAGLVIVLPTCLLLDDRFRILFFRKWFGS